MITRPHVKINLGLNVLRKREDGFHDIDTLFVPYDGFHDTLEIIPGDDWSRTSASLFARYGDAAGNAPRLVQAVSPDGRIMITVARAEGVDWDPRKDLTVRAYELLAADYDLPPVKIFLEKTSPVGAGLGGGSADAAFALRMLSEIAGLGLSDPALAAYAARLGSDCAFFIYNRPMLGSGRGERLSPAPEGLPAFISVPGIRIPADAFAPDDGPRLADLPVTVSTAGEAKPASFRLAVVIPEGIAVSTAEAYRGIVPHLPEVSLGDVLAMPVDRWKNLLVNDFEHTIFARHPHLAAIKQALYDRGARYAAMSGSGSALFGLF